MTKINCISLFILVILWSCANQGSLNGGQKDETPPQLLSVKPENNSLNIAPKQIEFVFDENIKLEDLKKNLLISPILKHKPVIVKRPKSFILKIKDTLKENTTYNFNFGNAIVDLNEGNKLSGFNFVFSTGSEIDKGAINGKVIDAITNKPPSSSTMWATLYLNPTDSAFTTTTPNYVAPINTETGEFKFTNIAKGTYSTFIIDDQNFNYFYDLPNEKIAFNNSQLIIEDNSKTIENEFIVFEKQPEEGNITKNKHHKKKNTFSIEFDKKSNLFELTDSLGKISSYKKDIYKDSIKLWIPKERAKNKLYIHFKGKTIDTLSIRAFNEKKVDTILRTKITNASPFSYFKHLMLESSAPIEAIDKDKIILLEDSLSVAGAFDLKQDSLFSTKKEIDFDWKLGKEYQIILKDSAFQSMYGNYSDSTAITFHTPREDELGSVSFYNKEKGRAKHNIILQLKRHDEIVAENVLTEKDDKVEIKKLNSNHYSVTLILDENNNGQWDTGNYEKKLQPEKIINYNEEIEIRGNWDIEIDLDY